MVVQRVVQRWCRRCRGADQVGERWRGADQVGERWRGGEVERCRGAAVQSRCC